MICPADPSGVMGFDGRDRNDERAFRNQLTLMEPADNGLTHGRGYRRGGSRARRGRNLIGSVLVHQGKIVGRGYNRRVQRGIAILHGEMDALEQAGRLPASVYTQSVLYTTLSPCAMCSERSSCTEFLG